MKKKDKSKKKKKEVMLLVGGCWVSDLCNLQRPENPRGLFQTLFPLKNPAHL